MKRTLVYAALLCVLTGPVLAQQGDGTDVPARVNTFKPDKVPATDQRIAALKVPQGFEVKAFAKDLKNIRIIAVATNGDIYVSRREQGDVLLLKDANEDGVLDEAPRAVTHRPNIHGLAIGGGQLYMATPTEVFRAPINADGSLGAVERIINDLPDGGQHPNRTMAFGPDGMLYISVGSSCNACNETNPEHAALLRSTPDGKSRTIFASGLRNTIGFAWDPKSGELWGMDHGIDFLGDDVQPEELNHIVKGKQYGWPHIWGKDGQNPQSTPPGEITKAQWAQMSAPMTLGYTAHAAPMQMVFYTGSQFPAEYRGDAFVTMRGSWNRKPASGYEVVRVRFRNGQPTAFEPFLTGFLVDGGQKHVARPVGLAITRGGALLVGDDANGTLYRVSYSGGTPAAAQPTAIPSQSLERQVTAGTGVPLVLERTPETASIAVQSPAFQDGQPMPTRFSAYHEGVSPQLTWNRVPKAVTYVVVAEDPDASPINPFVHWVAWNIPGSLTGLPEGLQTQPRLTDPEGVLQGATSHGSIGYYGPKPPVGAPPHHYHFQILALDARLEVRPGATRDEVLKAAKGHVIGKGQLVGTYQQTDPPLK
ncbi:YbhB/YbcL family Raf kinase inhibitor-like protein [Stenotrophomonas sp. CFBP8994]|uniref:YbhB/YbcL family Raf kinase inhibitor-like protein n=1 Tax=Stenotrophomonas sp. CFBP8994 TaxID=3096527 RepID=UPI002A6A6CBE|nr:YbhB/YbcL family Raf kinase inhibitor-like protein [Stenotrophomonas sp. CFBP8994]MDY0978652.1 YbhB/YbcL family Raf kinase inhibitor-like protein [Stenotrophomonas sp. CFBP8994]